MQRAPHGGEGVGGPADEVGDLAVADFDDAHSAVGTEDDVDGEEGGGDAGGDGVDEVGDGFVDGGEGFAIEDEVAAFGVGEEGLDAADAEAAFDVAAEVFHFVDEGGDLGGVADDRAAGGLEGLDVVFDEEGVPV